MRVNVAAARIRLSQVSVGMGMWQMISLSTT